MLNFWIFLYLPVYAFKLLCSAELSMNKIYNLGIWSRQFRIHKGCTGKHLKCDDKVFFLFYRLIFRQNGFSS